MVLQNLSITRLRASTNKEGILGTSFMVLHNLSITSLPAVTAKGAIPGLLFQAVPALKCLILLQRIDKPQGWSSGPFPDPGVHVSC